MTTTTGATAGMAGSYNNYSSGQEVAVHSMIPYIHLGIDQLDVSTTSSSLVIADFGSSQGKNSIEAMKIIIEYLRQTNKLHTSPLVIHIDLPTNDWTTLFQLLAKDNAYQGAAIGRSFYEQCLPSNSLSIGFSSSSINWLSKIPCKVSNHRFYFFAEEHELQAFIDQAKADFSSFIEHRSRELVSGGVLILSILSFDQKGPWTIGLTFDMLYTCARALFTTKELSDFAVPVYFRSLSEYVDHALFDGCSLELIKIGLEPVKTPLLTQYQNGQLTVDQYIEGTRKILQSIFEFSVRQPLEINRRSKEEIDQLVSKFWIMYEEKLKEKSDLVVNNFIFVYAYLVLKKMNVTVEENLQE